VDDRLARLEAAVAALDQEVAELRARVARVDGGAAARPDTGFVTTLLDPQVNASAVQRWLALTGRTLVILGGAYLLRALTDAQVLPTRTGVALGLAYGAPWLLLASRAGSRGAQLDAFCYGLATALIGFPLVWEATYRFGVLSTPQSAMLLGILTAGALVLSAARGLQSLAWIVVFGALAAAFTLAIATSGWIDYTVLVIAIGLATLWLGYTREWLLLRWPAAAVAHLMLFIVTGRAAAAGSTRSVLVVQGFMLIGYLGSFALRTLVRNRVVIPFEVAQSIGVLITAFGGALFLIHSIGANVAPVAIGSLVLAAAVYVVAFGFVAHRRHQLNFLFYSLLALVLAVTGLALSAGAAAGTVVYAVCAVAAASSAVRARQPVLVLHAVIFAIAASVASGLLAGATMAIARPPAEWLPIGLLAVMSLAVASAVVAFPYLVPANAWGYLVRVPRAFLLWLLAWFYIGVATAVAVSLLAGAGGPEAPLVPTIRTTVLVGAIMLVASAGRREQWREVGWLTYPLLVLTGLKILFVDFPQGRPSTLFVALGLYGLALIFTPRLLRRESGGAPAPTPTM
jgi:hypothetical protein